MLHHVTGMLHLCYNNVTSVLLGCYTCVTWMLHLCYLDVTSVLHVCYLRVTVMLHLCDKDVKTWEFQAKTKYYSLLLIVYPFLIHT